MPLKIVKAPTQAEIDNVTTELRSTWKKPMTPPSQDETPAERLMNDQDRENRDPSFNQFIKWSSLASVHFSHCGHFLACLVKSGTLTVFHRRSGTDAGAEDTRRCWTEHEVEKLYSLSETKRQKGGTNRTAAHGIVHSGACRFSTAPLQSDERGTLLALALMDKRLIVRMACSGDLCFVLDLGASGFSLAFGLRKPPAAASTTAGTQLLAVATDRGVRVFDAYSGAGAFGCGFCLFKWWCAIVCCS